MPDLRAAAARVIEDMTGAYPVDEASATLLRTMAIETARSGDVALCRRVFDRFIEDNERLDKYEYLLLRALLTERVDLGKSPAVGGG